MFHYWYERGSTKYSYNDSVKVVEPEELWPDKSGSLVHDERLLADTGKEVVVVVAVVVEF